MKSVIHLFVKIGILKINCFVFQKECLKWQTFWARALAHQCRHVSVSLYKFNAWRNFR